MLYRFDGKQPTFGKETYISNWRKLSETFTSATIATSGMGYPELRGGYGRIEIGDGTAVEERVIVHTAERNQSDRQKGNHRAWCDSSRKTYRRSGGYRHGGDR